MKPHNAALLAMLVAFTLFSVLHFWAREAMAVDAQGLTTCGQGVILRSDGSITLDAWTTYQQPATMANAAQSPATLVAPSKIVVGASIKDGVKVCVESGDGAVCTTVGAVRALAAKK